jgi:ubiquitin-protein ligase
VEEHHPSINHTNTAQLWIQSPCIYPNQPPAFSCIENLWIERIVVHYEAPPMQPPEEQPSNTTSFEMTIIYNQWSPVFHLGALLAFLLEMTAKSCARPNARLTQPMNQTMNQNMNQNNMNPPNFCTSPMHANV